MNDEIKLEKSLNFWFWLGVCFTAVILLSLIGGFLNAQQLENNEGIAEPDNLVDAKLEFLKEDIIDSVEFNPITIDQDGKAILETIKQVRYYYAGDYTDKDIMAEGDYSYKERVDSNTVRIYGAPFILGDNGYRTLESATTSVMHWYEQVEMAAKDPISKLWDPLFIETHAQDQIDIYSDGRMHCDGTPSTCHSASTYNSQALSLDAVDYGLIVWPDNMERNVYTFDLSGLSGTVDSASFYSYWSAEQGAVIPYLVPTTWDNSGSDDWNDYTATELGHAEVTGNGYLEIEMNADGKTYIEEGLDTVLPFMMLPGDDFNNSTYASAYAKEYFSEYTGTDHDPYLELTLIAEEPPVSTTTASTTPGLLLPMADGLSMVAGVLCGWVLMLLFIYALWPA